MAPDSGLDGLVDVSFWSSPFHRHHRWWGLRCEDGGVKIHLVDGTYELFRQHFGQAVRSSDPAPLAATVGVLNSTLQLLSEGATHIGVASDHAIESFRNELWEGYKTSEGMDPVVKDQIPVMERALEAMGVTVWAMVEYEADDALASAAAVADSSKDVEQILIFTADKDLGQCVKGRRIVQVDRRKQRPGTNENGMIDEAGVIAKFGVPPSCITDYLALVGDSSDGFPGVAGWGAKSASAVLARYRSIDDIPTSVEDWDVPGLRGAGRLCDNLNQQRDLALLFRTLATAVATVPVGRVADWEWKGPTDAFAEVCGELGVPRLAERAIGLARSRHQ